jgi:hypothetical protein
MTPTPELREFLTLLYDEQTSRRIKQGEVDELFCEAWDIHPSHLKDYISLTTSGKSSSNKLSSETSTPAGFNPPRLRQSHSISTFG